MIFSILGYIRSEVGPRWREIIVGTELVLAIGLGVVTFLWGSDASIGSAHLANVLTAVLAYAAVAFGFCLTGLTVAMTLPDPTFTRVLATCVLPSPPPGTGLAARSRRRRYRRTMRRDDANAYSDLLFVFSWTAVAHWAAIVWAFVLLGVYGSSHEFVPKDPTTFNRLGAAMLSTVVLYAGLQFLITLLTLAGVGAAYIEQLRQRSPGEN